MLNNHCLSLLVLSVAAISATACSSRPSDWKETYPVTGVVFVDGKAAKELNVTLHPVTDDGEATMSSTFTDAEGKFSLSTYAEGDGVPEGEYIATFSWGTLNMISMAYEHDRLKGKYANREKSEHRVTVKAGVPTDLGRIELTTP